MRLKQSFKIYEVKTDKTKKKKKRQMVYHGWIFKHISPNN